ncbi:pseudouridine synthase [Lipomyces arxii]|uniref:pseudouridine synthase n=1 Tax=Lipomyces arxii TaxID=56418 RepID=UPI0034D00F32
MLKADYKFWTKKDLIDRIKELESASGNGVEQSKLEGPAESKNKFSKAREFNFGAHSTRYVALKFAYMGWNYNGLNVQQVPTPLPTVEGLILEALATCKLLEDPDDLDKCEFNRCGRTDKGVSALAQVISLRIRSRLTPEEQQDEANDDIELSYITMLNNLLPPDIRFYQASLHPPEGFNARFSCKSRHYKYFFVSRGKNLDIAAMRQGAAFIIGTHDFRNFCKIDGSKQITNFVRTIYDANIEAINHGHRDNSEEELYVFNLKGSAFLWHQVRCIMGVLLLVGQGLESPAVVNQLLDIEKYPCKPIYDMAYEIPLVLYDCEFGDDVKWKGLSDFNNRYAATASGNIRGDAYGLWYDGVIKNELQYAMRNIVETWSIEKSRDAASSRIRVDTGDGIGRWFSEYVPLEKREMMSSFEELNARWLSRKTKILNVTGKVNSNSKFIEKRRLASFRGEATNETDYEEPKEVAAQS